MTDLISRAAALDAIDGMKPMQGSMEQLAMKALCWAAVKTIQPVDAATVVQGEWVEEPDRRGHYHCSNCGVVWGVSAKAMKYCPNCAAKMMNSPMWEVDGERGDEDAADTR